MPKVMITFTHDEIQERLAYQLICETRESSKWNTTRRKRRWLEEFSEQEREAATKIFAKAHRWTLITGVPESVTMAISTLALWDKLREFCASI